MFQKAREKAMALVDNYTTITSKTNKGFKILIPEQMFQRLPIAFAQVKTC